MPQIDYIINSTKPYPSWIKEHRVFKLLPKIEKIFPQIGLSNFTKQIAIYPTELVKSYARQFTHQIANECSTKAGIFRQIFNQELTKNGRERNEKCQAYQSACNLLMSLYWNMFAKELCSVVDGKISISLENDLFHESASPLFKKGESVFKVITKLNSIIVPLLPSSKIDYEANSNYKEYSRLNLPGKEYQLTFSSTGEDGAWDIATASMRGITSCQTWNAGQARGLIGSITSKYVAVMFIAGNENINPYGKKMLHRCFVRLVIERNSGQPALFMDTMYPGYNEDIHFAMKKELEERSGLKVYSCSINVERNTILQNYYLLDEPSRIHLREGEYSYMDSIIPIQQRPIQILFSHENGMLQNRQAHFISQLEMAIEAKRALYEKNIKELKEYIANGERNEKPEMIPVFNDLKRGKYSFQNTLNFFAHCHRPHSTTNKPTTYFLQAIFRAMGNSTNCFTTPKEADIWLLRRLATNFEEIRAASWQELEGGSWMKSFPSSAKRFHETVLFDLKKALLFSCKNN